MSKARKILKWLTMLFLLLAVLSGLGGAATAMAVFIYAVVPVGIGYITLGILWYIGKYTDPKPEPMPDPYWPPSRTKGGARR